MALIIKDRVQETSTTSGTGTITLGGAVTGYQSFASAIGSGNTTYYAIYETQTVNWEVGIGTVGSGTLARTTVLASSNGGSLVSFGGAQLAVYGDYPAGKAVYRDSTGNVTGFNFSTPTIVDYETFTSQSTNPSYAAGTLWYAQDNDALTFFNSATNNDLHLGQEVQLRVYNSTGSTIAAGAVVYVNGQHSQFPTVALAQANSSSTANAIGLVNTSIANNAYGYVVVLGKFTGLDTHSFNAGDALYLSSTTAGGVVNVMPTNPNLAVFIGYCVYSNPSMGVVEVNVPLPPVSATGLTGIVPVVSGGTGISTTPTNGQIPIGNGTNYTAATLTAGTGISVTNSSGGITITNTSPSSGGTVTSITAGTGLSGGTITGSGTIAIANTAVTAGSYTNASLTVNAQGQLTAASSGTAPVTSVTGTSPISSSGGATPAISISQASGTTNGYLSSTDWTTFNNKGSGTVTSVTGTSPIASTGGATPAISISQATTSTNGYLSSTDWNTFNGKGSGTVTSVGGTGTVNGLTLTGTVTSTGNLTLGGTLSLASPPTIGNTTPNSGAFTTLSSTGNTSFSGSNVSISIQPTGTGVVYVNPATTGSMDNMTIGATTPAAITGTNIIATGGLYGKSTFGGTYADGIVADYSTGNGRISVGTNDTITFYNGGVANTQLAQLNTAGNLQINGGIYVNSKTIGANYTIPSGSSGMSTGPITISSGVTVTVSSGSKWVVL